MSTLQDKINKDIDSRFDISLFKSELVVQMFKNTYGIKCPKCKSEQIYEKSVQTRSADEAASIFRTCLNCNYKWQAR